MQKAKHPVTHPFVFAPILVLILIFFITVSRFIPMNKLGITGTCLLMCLFQAFMFGIPIGIYAYMRRGALRTVFEGRLSFSGAPVIIFGALMLIFQSCVLKFGIFRFGYHIDAYQLYGSSFDVSAGSAVQLAAITASYAIVPAIAEEIMFRGIISREYRIGGPVYSAVLSSFFFAMIHFDAALFPVYFCAGLTLSAVRFVTDSLAASMAVHAAYNIFSVFLERYVWLMSSSPDSQLLFWFMLIALFLLCAFLFFRFSASELENAAYSDRAYPFGKAGVKKLPLYIDALISPSALICIAVFVVSVIIAAIV